MRNLSNLWPKLTVCAGVALLVASIGIGFQEASTNKLAQVAPPQAVPPDIVAPSEQRAISVKAIEEAIQFIESDYVDKDQIPSREQLIQIAVDAILKEVGDAHGHLLSAREHTRLQETIRPRAYGGLNIQISKIKNGSSWEILILQLFEGSPLSTFDVKAGDTITHVEGEQVTEDNFADMIANIRGNVGSDVTIRVKRNGSTNLGDLVFQRVTSKLQTVFVAERNCYAHVRITQFTQSPQREIASQLSPILKKCGGIRGMILDVRSDPGGSLSGSINASDIFLEKGKPVVKIVKNDGTEVTFDSTHDPAFPDNLPVVALIDEKSASASEILVGALKKHRSKYAVLGVKTYGKGSVQTVHPLDNGMAVKITTARYYAGGDIEIDGKGIEPNIEVVQPDPPGSGDTNKWINKFFIRTSMEPEIDHQLRVAYEALRIMGLTHPGLNNHQITLRALEAAEKIEPRKITFDVCKSHGLRGCLKSSPPGERAP